MTRGLVSALGCLLAMLSLAFVGGGRGTFVASGQRPSSGLDYQILIDAETGAAGDQWRSNATPASLQSAISLGSSLCSITIASNNAGIASNRLFVVNGTAGLVKDGTRAFEYNDNVSPPNAMHGGGYIHLNDEWPILSVQFWIRFGTMWNGSAFQSFDPFKLISDAAAEYLVFNVYDGTGTIPLEFSIHTQAGANIMNSDATNATFYLVDMHWNSNTMGTLIRVRDTNGNLFCSGSNNLTSALSVKHIQFGMIDGHGATHAGSPSIIVDRIKISTNGNFPLGFN